MTTSASATASAAVSATRAPSSARGFALSVLRFQTVTSRPSRSRLRVIPAPMIPVPSTATVVLMEAAYPRGSRPMPKNSALGRSAVRCARRLDIANRAVIAPMSQISSSDRPASRASSRSSSLQRRRLEGQRQRQVDDRAAARVELRAVGVDPDVVGELGLLAADAQDRAVGDHAVGAVVGAGRRDDHQLALGLRQRGLPLHERVVVVEERPQLRRPVAEGAEDVGDEPRALGDGADALAEVVGELVELDDGEAADGIGHARAP